MDLQLAGAVMMVTGGTDGLGAALADRLVEEGARVAICGRDASRLEAATSRLAAAGGDVLGRRADVTRSGDLEDFIEAVLDRWGRVDGLVNNAGRASGGAFESVPDDEWQEDFDLKVMAAVRLSRLVAPSMRQVGGGSMVNVLNIGAKAPSAQSLPTSASRAAGLAITKALSKELAPDGIRVNAVCIGLVESGQWRRRAEASGQTLATLYQQLAAGVPLGRVGRADEFADLVAYLLSNRSSYVTGSSINLDGGASPVI
jgi:NAD(P)-dependent dehydrogenase (short-subunit alcohol dehydrogenase family)